MTFAHYVLDVCHYGTYTSYPISCRFVPYSRSDLGFFQVKEREYQTRSSPIFERHLGRPLDIRLIRPGGYQDIDHMLDHLVPAMMLKVS